MINPNRRKSKDNPYKIVFNNVEKIYIVSFKDGTNKLNEVEVSKEIFDVFNESELNDISTMHKDRKHIDYRNYDDSEIIENLIFNKSKDKYKILEDDYIKEVEHQELRKVIDELSNIQKRRIKMYYFEELNLEQIAKIEHTSFQMISKSIKQGIENLKKILKNKI